MRPYADTNLLTRFYLRLAESEGILRSLDQAQLSGSAPLPVTWLHRLEVANGFQLYVFAGKTAGPTRVTPEQAAAAHAAFRSELANATFLRSVPLSLPELEAQFEELALRHTAKHGFRTYDLLHVASALVLGCDAFWSFDPKANRLASFEGLHAR